MDRRTFLRRAAAVGAGLALSPSRARAAAELLAGSGHALRAAELMRRSTVIDMLGLLTLDWSRLEEWQDDPARFGPEDQERLRASGIDVFHPAVEPRSGDPHGAAIRWMNRWNRFIDSRGELLQRIDGVEDLDRVRLDGRTGILCGLQSSRHFRHPGDVWMFRALGQRVSQLTYDESDEIGGGCRGVDDGLTPLGREVVTTMNRAGVAIDLSHCGERTSLEAIEHSDAPVLVTHSNCRALVAGHPRCKSDLVIRELAARGGVMGITMVKAFVSQAERATIEDVLDHFEHVVQLVGVEHVGLGSDVDVDGRDPKTNRPRAPYVIEGLDHPRRTFQIAEGLLRRGLRESEVELVLGGNFRRVLGEIWRA